MMYKCPYKTCDYKNITQEDIDDHIVAAHMHGNDSLTDDLDED